MIESRISRVGRDLKDHRSKSPGPAHAIPESDHMPESVVQTLIEFCRPEAVITSLGSLLQCPATPRVKSLNLTKISPDTASQLCTTSSLAASYRIIC